MKMVFQSFKKIIKSFPGLISVFGFLILSGCLWAGVTSSPISEIYPHGSEEISAFGWVGVEFSQPVEHASVESAFSITPAVEGAFIWQENTVWFRPLLPFDLSTNYEAQISGEVEIADGSRKTISKTWEITVREPSLIYFDQGEIWRISTDGSDQVQLSQSNGRVIEFSPERSGEWITYTGANDLGGTDVWIMDRDGENERLLVNCGQDQCEEPAWAMDRTRIAYTRETYQSETGGYLPAQIWTVDVQLGETSPLYQSDMAFNHSPSFSPDGRHFASYDINQNGIRILDLETFKVSIVPRILPGVGDWSQDGQQILFTDIVSADNEPFVDMYIDDLNTKEIVPAFGKEMTDTDFSQPRWMPGGEWIAASLRPVNSNANKELWVIRLQDAFGIPISDDPTALFAAYQWDPWGNQLIYQRLELTSSEPPASIWLWDWETRESRMLIDNAARPAWLP